MKLPHRDNRYLEDINRLKIKYTDLSLDGGIHDCIKLEYTHQKSLFFLSTMCYILQ